MPCLFALMAGFAPRLAALFLWLARPAMWSAAFNGSWFWPLLGVIFLPFTTIMYVILWSPGIGLTAWDWMWLILAVLCDLRFRFRRYVAKAARDEKQNAGAD